MTRMISLFFIRHGQGYHNIAYQLFGENSFGDEQHIDAKLTDHGIEQAKNLQQYFIDNMKPFMGEKRKSRPSMDSLNECLELTGPLYHCITIYTSN